VLRLFLISIFFLDLFACKGGYDSCKSKLIDSHSIKNNSLYIPVTQSTRLVYSKSKPKEKILKYDPFLGLYLVKSNDWFKYPFQINNFLSFGYAVVDDKNSNEIKIKSSQIGLNHFASTNEKIKFPSLLTNSCCALEGIVTDRGIIQKEYIERFLNSKDIRYSDMGFRLYNDDKKVVIKRINPFLKNNPFKNEDIILEIDGKKVKNASSLMRKVLFSKVGSNHKIKIKRGSDIISINVKTFNRIGGGYKCDTFLESRGLYVGNGLRLLKIEKEFAKYGLKVGDKILKANGNTIENIDDLGAYLSGFKGKSSILFERNGFQFFINIK
jgi:hypothetical protein